MKNLVTSLKERCRAFSEWQERPREVLPISDAEHDCPTCNTHYRGNYCPRCGQSALVGRYSFRMAFQHFMNVWGLGNRSLFITLRDLILRPGYMIRDYLKGMQMAYFPPFQMLCLLTTLSIAVAYGMNVEGESFNEKRIEQTHAIFDDASFDEDDDPELNDKLVVAFESIIEAQERFPNIMSLISVVFMTLFLYVFFRRSKSIPDLRLSEFFIAMVIAANMTSLYETVLRFFCFESPAISLTYFLNAIPLKQMSGFSWIGTLLRMLGAVVLMVVAVIVAAFVITLVVGLALGKF